MRPSDMTNTTSMDDTRIDCIQASLAFERELAERGATPNLAELPHNRARAKFELIGAVMLALYIAGMSLFGAFFVFNVMLQWEF